MKTYRAYGLEFTYPDDWQVIQTQFEEGVNIHVQSPGTAFWSLMLLPSCPHVDEAVASVLTAMKEEYENIDIYPEQPPEGPYESAQCSLDFVSFDLVNSAVIRATALDEYTMIVLYQSESREFEQRQGDWQLLMDSLSYSPGLSFMNSCDDDDDEEDEIDTQVIQEH
ncbi:MAG: hypothetical protein KatS3mg114_0254 [Planctomycetaceae bacterium]|nr:MAG: hypothetical protein KatS3mg114_0254 [Planctomycetaceae bacterium]